MKTGTTQSRVHVGTWAREGALIVRAGSRPIEFEKGKAAIIVPNKEQLLPTIDAVIAAVRAGELDEHVAQRAIETLKDKRAA